MRLICPNCVAQYEVDENVIPSEGRDVQCANCGHNWFQDSVQMLSSDDEDTIGKGDPESDVPPELFNDLEGKLSSGFVSTRSNVTPNPDDTEPEEARDDFQIEQEPDAPSTKLDKDSLDVLHQEAEYSSGEKPPAASTDKEAETLSTTPTEDIIDDTVDHADDETDAPLETASNNTAEPEETKTPVVEEISDETDDIDEIRRQIMDLENVENNQDRPEDSVEQSSEEPDDDPLDYLTIPDLDQNVSDSDDEDPATEQAEISDRPFSRPVSRRVSSTERPKKSVEQLYEENIPSEKDIPDPKSQHPSIDDAIETLMAKQIQAERAQERPHRNVSARRFPNIDETSDDLYGASEERAEARKNLFPDVDDLSSDIAHEAETGNHDQSSEAGNKIKGGFVKGFKYALLLYIIIGIIYLLQPFILEYIPQSEGFLNLISKLVNAISDAFVPLIDKAKELILQAIS